jgi:hypothetical protein
VLRECVVGLHLLIWTVAAIRSAAIPALEMISSGEDHVGAFKVVIIGFKRGRFLFAPARRILTHLSILS